MQCVFLTTCKEHQEGKMLYEQRIDSTIRCANMSLPDQCLWPSSYQPSVSTHCKDADEWQGKKINPQWWFGCWCISSRLPPKKHLPGAEKWSIHFVAEHSGQGPAQLLPCCVVLLPSAAPENERKGCVGITTREVFEKSGAGPCLEVFLDTQS